MVMGVGWMQQPSIIVYTKYMFPLPLPATISSAPSLCFCPRTHMSSLPFHHHHHHYVSTTRRRRLPLVSSKQEPNDWSPEESAKVPVALEEKKKGTVLGAVSLIVGTSIGSGILALPQKTAPVGIIPSAACMVICWAFLLIEALLLAEINAHLWNNRKKIDDMQGGGLAVISLRTMAQETLGEWGGNIASITYLFLGYTSLIAYTSKSGEILSHFINISSSISGILFTLLVALLLLVGGTDITDKVNQFLTISMIGLLVIIEVMAVSFDGSLSSTAISNWEKVPEIIPLVIFTLVYHDIAPVICAYLGGDLVRVRLSIVLGSIVPLISLLIWENIVLSSNLDGVDPLDLLMRGRWSTMSMIVEVFALLAVGTSLIGTLLGFSQFFVEQLVNLSIPSPSTQVQEKVEKDCPISVAKENAQCGNTKGWWISNNLALLGTSMAVFPSMLISAIVPDAFSVATDIAGGYCMTILYGVLPPAMAWAIGSRLYTGVEINDQDELKQDHRWLTDSNAKPVLLWVGLFSCGIVMEQVVQDIILGRS